MGQGDPLAARTEELRNLAGGYHAPRAVVGITSAQTCLVLHGRLRALRQAGFDVTLVCSPGELLDSTAASEGVMAIPLPMERGIAPMRDLLAFCRLLLLMRRLRPQLVEFSTPKAGLLGTLAAKLCRVPVRVYLLRGLKLESTHGLKRRLLLLCERATAWAADRVLCNSESLMRKAQTLRIGRPEKLVLLGKGSSNGVDIVRFQPGESEVRHLLGLPQNALVVGFVGRLTRDKGIPDLVEAFGKILAAEPRSWLLLVGWFDAAEDALSDEEKRQILNHPRILHTGFVANPADYYRAMELLVLPTRREGFPNVVLEAAACGLPVVTTLSTGARDAVLPEVTGLLIPAGYPEAISEAVLRLLRNPAERARMGAAARDWVSEFFVDDQVLGEMVNFYRHLLRPASNVETKKEAQTTEA